MAASQNDVRPSSWPALVGRLAHVALEEVRPLLPRKVLAEAAAAFFPQQSFNRTRTALLRAAGVKIGLHSLILGPVRLTGIGDPCPFLTIGAYTIITGPLHADLAAPVKIGDGVRLGHDVALLTINHQVGGPRLRSGVSFFAPITIGDGAWIASRVTVLPGVTIGASSIVAAGSVVTRDVPENTLVAGVPARVMRSLSADGNTEPHPDAAPASLPPDSLSLGIVSASR